MNEVRTVAELEQTLKTIEPEVLQPDALAAIRTRGGRRRRARAAGVVAGAVAAVAFASIGLVAVTGGAGPRASDLQAAKQPTWSPTTLSSLGRRVLSEIPSAVQVSDEQVVIPEPPGAKNVLTGVDVEDGSIDGARVDVGVHSYHAVTSFAPGAFPAWLYDAVSQYGADDHEAGAIAEGVLVDAGSMELACVRAPYSASLASGPDGTVLSGTGSAPPPASECTPMLIGRANNTWTVGRTMWTDGFLEQGQGLQMFSADTYTSGAKDTVWIGGTYGTEVSSVELVGADGSTVPATVESGTVTRATRCSGGTSTAIWTR